MIAPDALYLNDPECLIILFDLREPCAAEILGRERALWPEHTDIEVLDEFHAALIRWPGWVSEPAA